MIIAVNTPLSISKLRVCLVYRWYYIYQVDLFIDTDSYTTLSRANLIGFEIIWHKEFAKLDEVVLGFDAHIVAITKVFLNATDRDLQFSSFTSLSVSSSILMKCAQRLGVKVELVGFSFDHPWQLFSCHIRNLA